MQGAFRVSIDGSRLRFAAAHMATFDGRCEPLHGHNYAVSIEAEGDLTADGWVWDFGDLRRIAAGILDEFDHRFLLQERSSLLRATIVGGNYELHAGGQTYVLPCSDVVALPIDNTTAERLAEWIAGRLLAALRANGASNIRRLAVGVEEMPGQSGWYTLG